MQTWSRFRAKCPRAFPAPQTHPCRSSNTVVGLRTWPALQSLQICHPSATRSVAVLNKMPECTATAALPSALPTSFTIGFAISFATHFSSRPPVQNHVAGVTPATCDAFGHPPHASSGCQLGAERGGMETELGSIGTQEYGVGAELQEGSPCQASDPNPQPDPP